MLSLFGRWNFVACGRTAFTVAGLHFGYADATASAHFGGACLSVSWTSASSAACNKRAWHGGVVAEVARLTLGTVVGTSLRLLTFDAPVLSDAAPSHNYIRHNYYRPYFS